MIRTRRLVATAAFLAAPLATAHAQSNAVELTVNHIGVGIGDAPKIYGIRLNFRDRDDFEVHGINATIWPPEGEPRGTVDGLALGLPLTGAGRITGIGAGIFGVSATDRITGLGVGGLGLGAGGRLDGIMIAGIGVGAPRIEGFASAAAVGAQDARAVIIAPAYMRIDRGTFTGVSASAFNHIKGTSTG